MNSERTSMVYKRAIKKNQSEMKDKLTEKKNNLQGISSRVMKPRIK